MIKRKRLTSPSLCINGFIVPYDSTTIHRKIEYSHQTRQYSYCDGKQFSSPKYHCFGEGIKGLFTPWLNASPGHLGIILCSPCNHCCSDVINQINNNRKQLIKKIIQNYKYDIKEIKHKLEAEISKYEALLKEAKQYE